MEKVKNYFKSINVTSLGKRSIFLVISMVLMYFGIACYYQAKLGTDPYSVMVDGEHYIMGLTYGWVTNINNLVLFTLMLLFGRKYINIGTVVTSVFAGKMIDLFNELIVNHLLPETLIGQSIMLLIGVVSFATGLGLYIVADMGIGGIEFTTISLSRKTGVDLRWIRTGFDVCAMVIGIILGLCAGKQVFDMIGIGTVLGAFGTGVIMKFVIKKCEPFSKWFGPLRKELSKAE